MKSLRLLALLMIIVALLAAHALAQAPAITSFTVKDTGCYYKVGTSTRQCSLAPGMTLTILGTNFGNTGGIVSLCSCTPATIVKWTPTRIIAIINVENPNSSLAVVAMTGSASNTIAYTALGPVITSIVVGNCAYVPNQSPNLCLITPGTQFTINGSYFGPLTSSSAVVTCDCSNATINSWNPNWATSPSPYNNQIVVTATQAVCGSTVAVYADTLWSNYIPYTSC